MSCYFCFAERTVPKLSKEHLLSKPVAAAFGLDRSGTLGQWGDGDDSLVLARVDAGELERVSSAERRLRVREEALAVLREQGHIPPQRALAKVVNEVSDAVVGMGPIEFLLKDRMSPT